MLNSHKEAEEKRVSLQQDQRNFCGQRQDLRIVIWPLLKALTGLNVKTLSPKNIRNRLELVRSYNKMVATPCTFPSMVQVEVTNRCNLKCVMCPVLESKRKKGDMSLDTFKRVVDDSWELCELLVLTGGEPLLNRNIFEMISYANKKKIRTWLATNATLLDAEKSRRLLNSGLDQLILSFDDTNKEIYEATRIRGNYEGTLANVVRFLTMAERSRHKIFITIQLISMNDTEPYIEQFLRKWSKYDINTFIKPVVNWRASDHDWRFKHFRCDKPWFWTAVHYDGTVVPCGHDYHQSEVMGNVWESDLKNIWTNDKYAEFRKRIVEERKLNDLCEYCEYISPRPRSIFNDVSLVLLDMATVSKVLLSVGYKKT